MTDTSKFLVNNDGGIGLNTINYALLNLFNEDQRSHGILDTLFKGYYFRSWYNNSQLPGYGMGNMVISNDLSVVDFLTDHATTVKEYLNYSIVDDYYKLLDYDAGNSEVFHAYKAAYGTLFDIGKEQYETQLYISLVSDNKAGLADNTSWCPYLATQERLESFYYLANMAYTDMANEHTIHYHYIDDVITDEEVQELAGKYVSKVDTAGERELEKLCGWNCLVFDSIKVTKPVGEAHTHITTSIGSDNSARITGLVFLPRCENATPVKTEPEYNRVSANGIQMYRICLSYDINDNQSSVWLNEDSVSFRNAPLVQPIQENILVIDNDDGRGIKEAGASSAETSDDPSPETGIWAEVVESGDTGYDISDETCDCSCPIEKGKCEAQNKIASTNAKIDETRSTVDDLDAVNDWYVRIDLDEEETAMFTVRPQKAPLYQSVTDLPELGKYKGFHIRKAGESYVSIRDYDTLEEYYEVDKKTSSNLKPLYTPPIVNIPIPNEEVDNLIDDTLTYEYDPVTADAITKRIVREITNGNAEIEDPDPSVVPIPDVKLKQYLGFSRMPFVEPTYVRITETAPDKALSNSLSLLSPFTYEFEEKDGRQYLKVITSRTNCYVFFTVEGTVPYSDDPFSFASSIGKFNRFYGMAVDYAISVLALRSSFQKTLGTDPITGEVVYKTENELMTTAWETLSGAFVNPSFRDFMKLSALDVSKIKDPTLVSDEEVGSELKPALTTMRAFYGNFQEYVIGLDKVANIADFLYVHANDASLTQYDRWKYTLMLGFASDLYSRMLGDSYKVAIDKSYSGGDDRMFHVAHEKTLGLCERIATLINKCLSAFQVSEEGEDYSDRLSQEVQLMISDLSACARDSVKRGERALLAAPSIGMTEAKKVALDVIDSFDGFLECADMLSDMYGNELDSSTKTQLTEEFPTEIETLKSDAEELLKEVIE